MTHNVAWFIRSSNPVEFFFVLKYHVSIPPRGFPPDRLNKNGKIRLWWFLALYAGKKESQSPKQLLRIPLLHEMLLYIFCVYSKQGIQ